MLAGPGIEKNAGLAGFDWVTHARDPQAADADMDLKLIEEVGGIVTTRDRYQFVEGLSGWKFDDSLKGNDVVPAPEHSLDAAGIARITGLADLLGAGVDLRSRQATSSSAVPATTPSRAAAATTSSTATSG